MFPVRPVQRPRRMQVTMKVQHLPLSFWPADAAEPSSPSTSSNSSSSSSSSLIMSLNHLSPLAPCKLASPSATLATHCAKMTSFNTPRPAGRCASQKHDACLMETLPSGATRWNPMPEQIKVLEALYQSGMRTPNANQIEDITAELCKYGRIEGKNVFYWFQNHKARERQKQKRSALLALTMSCSTAQANCLLDPHLVQQEEGQMEMKEKGDGSCNKRKCRSRCGLQLQQSGSSGSGHDHTLELFPLHPERKQIG